MEARGGQERKRKVSWFFTKLRFVSCVMYGSHHLKTVHDASFLIYFSKFSQLHRLNIIECEVGCDLWRGAEGRGHDPFYGTAPEFSLRDYQIPENLSGSSACWLGIEPRPLEYKSSTNNWVTVCWCSLGWDTEAYPGCLGLSVLNLLTLNAEKGLDTALSWFLKRK